MLALTRKINESIIIDDNIEITILEVKGEQVKIGISAPKSIPIYRKELYVEIKDSNKEAANSVDIINNLKDIFK
ncbi:MAG TPA: carbon storage regulator CsrA [Clostridiales bacterium]|nr:carbon storage regulator CsrA [Clostridiales bacterium]